MSFLFGSGGGGGLFLSSISSGGSGGTAAAAAGAGGGTSPPTTASSGGRSSPSGASSSSLSSSFASGVSFCRNAALHGGMLFLAVVADPIHRCGSSVTRSLFRRMTKSQRLWWSAFSKGAVSVLVGLVCYRIGRACVSHLISSPSSSSSHSHNGTASASQTRRSTDNEDEEDHLFVDMRVSLFESFSRDVQALKSRIVERLKAVEEQQQQNTQQQERNPGSTGAEEAKESPTKVRDRDVGAPEDTETVAAAAAAATTCTSSSRKKTMEQDLIWIDEHITKLLIRIDEAPVAGLEELRSRRRRLLEEGLSLEAWLKRLSGAMGGL